MAHAGNVFVAIYISYAYRLSDREVNIIQWIFQIVSPSLYPIMMLS